MLISRSKDEFFDDFKLYGFIEFTSLACLVVILVLILGTPYFKDYPLIVATVICFEIAVAVFRRVVFSTLKKEQNSGIDYKFLKLCVSTGIYAGAIVWSGFSIVTFSLYGLELPTLIVFINAVGIASSVTFVLSADSLIARKFVAIFILPFASWCLFSGRDGGYAIAIISIVYLLVMLKNSAGYSNWFAIKKHSIEKLNSRLFTLAEMNNRLRAEITYRKSVENALRTSEERYKALFENNPIETIIVDSDAKIVRINSAKKMTSGRVPAIGDIMYKEYGSKHENDMYAELIDSMRSGMKKEFPEQKYNDRYLNIRISPVDGGAIITSLDITRQKRAEKHIQELTREIMLVQEKERKRISRDLHDSVAQELSTLRISCETFFDDGDAAKESIIADKIRKMSTVLHGSIQTVRNIAYELRPPCLDELGLGTSLHSYCEEFSTKTGIKVDFFSAGFDNIKIDSEIEINIYRLVQESLNNIKKHASALHVHIRLVVSYPFIILRIEDNGLGFEKELLEKTAQNSRRMGVRGMEERVNLFGGRFKLKTRPGKGTSVVIEIPFRTQNDPVADDQPQAVANS